MAVLSLAQINCLELNANLETNKIAVPEYNNSFANFDKNRLTACMQTKGYLI